MKKIIFLSLFLSFGFYSQSTFAANFNTQIAYDTSAYTFTLSDELQQLQNTPSQNKSYDLIKPEDFYSNHDEFETQQNEQPKAKKQKKHKPAKHYNPSQPETPKWWREENSFQGWGFN